MSTVVLYFALSSAGWLIYHKPAFKGLVLDAETKEPIQGAVVEVVYERILAGLGPGWSAFPFDIRETLTDSHGMFQVPSYTTLIHPFSFNSFAKFIIKKPEYGYGSGDELFFSEDFGKEKEIDSWRGSVRDGNGPERYKSMVTFGIVELPKLKTREDRLKAITPPDGGISPLTLHDKTPILNKMIYNEEKALGLLDNRYGTHRTQPVIYKSDQSKILVKSGGNLPSYSEKALAASQHKDRQALTPPSQRVAGNGRDRVCKTPSDQTP